MISPIYSLLRSALAPGGRYADVPAATDVEDQPGGGKTVKPDGADVGCVGCVAGAPPLQPVVNATTSQAVGALDKCDATRIKVRNNSVADDEHVLAMALGPIMKGMQCAASGFHCATHGSRRSAVTRCLMPTALECCRRVYRRLDKSQAIVARRAQEPDGTNN